ncbi:FG-GAP repeat domain-containing protein [Aliikangiella sp. IMCC44359]|uniref:FG-GAP repeat domain-containing protein n=1 Tax=Aliikangiella sp. IMCC44359 TaxID=3459125 RepID=UPI00403B0851
MTFNKHIIALSVAGILSTACSAYENDLTSEKQQIIPERNLFNLKDIYGRQLVSDRRLTESKQHSLLSPQRQSPQSSHFTVGQAYKPGKTSIGAVEFGDIDGDGDIELVAVSDFYFDSENDYSAFIFHPNENGLGQPERVSYDARANRNGLELSDLNQDGKEEIIIGHSSGLTIINYISDGNFSTQKVTSSASDTLSTMDINLDGQLDILGLPWRAPATQYFGDGQGGFSSTSNLATNASGYNDQAVGDLNSDGLDDFVVMSGQSYSTPNFSVHLHNGNNQLLAPQTYFVGSSETTSGIDVGDINGDGRDDVVLSRGRNSPTHLWVYTQNAQGELDGPTQLPTYDIPETLKIADLNSDGFEDIVVLHGGWTTMGVYLNSAEGYGEEIRVSIPYASHYDPEGLAFGDLNQDGCPEMIAIADYNHGVIPVTHNLCPEEPVEIVTMTDQGSIDAEEKYYDFSVSGGIINVSVSFTGIKSDLDLHLYNSAGELVAQGFTLENPETLTFDTKGNADCFRLELRNYTNDKTDYTLTYRYQL